MSDFTPEMRKLLAFVRANPTFLDKSNRQYKAAVQAEWYHDAWRAAVVLQIVGFLKEVLSSDDYVVCSEDELVQVMPRNGDGSHYWQFQKRREGWLQTDFVEGFFSSDYENIVFTLDNTRHSNPPKDSDALTIAKWIVSIVTADRESLGPSCPDGSEFDDGE